MKSILFSLLSLFFILTILVEGGSELRNMANRSSLKNRGRNIRVESKRLSDKMKQAKEFEKMSKTNQQQGLYDLAEKHEKSKLEIENSAKLNQENLNVLRKKHPSKLTRTSSGKQRIVPAITSKQEE